MKPVGCPETSAKKYHYNTLEDETHRLSRNVSKELIL